MVTIVKQPYVHEEQGADSPFADSPFNVLHINGAVVVRPRGRDDLPFGSQSVTGREKEVLCLVAEGFSNKRVADSLGISERTVKNHLTSIMTKLGASDRTHAVVIAVRTGWMAI